MRHNYTQGMNQLKPDLDPITGENPAEATARMLEELAARFRSGELQPWTAAGATTLAHAQQLLTEDQQLDRTEHAHDRPRHLQAFLLTFTGPQADGGEEEVSFSRRQPQFPKGPANFDKGSRSGHPLEPDANNYAAVELTRMVASIRLSHMTVWRGYLKDATPIEAAKACVWLEREYFDLPGLKVFMMPYLEDEPLDYETAFGRWKAPEEPDDE